MKPETIDFSFNNRVNDLVALCFDPSLSPNQPLPGVRELVTDLYRYFDPPADLESLKEGKHPTPPWQVIPGPGLYCLYDTAFHGLYPAIIYIGRAKNVEYRIASHQKKEWMWFDGARSVFIENYGFRCLLETRLKNMLKHPESGHSDSLSNIR